MKLDLVPAFPVQQLRATLLASDTSKMKDKPCLYINRGGIGSGILLLTIVGICVYWHCRKCPWNEARSTSLSMSCTVPEYPTIKHAYMGATRTHHSTALSQETGEDPESSDKKVTFNKSVDSSEARPLLDNLEVLCIDVIEHYRRLHMRHYASLSNFEVPSSCLID